MNRKSLGLIFLILGVVLFLGGLAGGVGGFMGMIAALEPVAEFKSPDQVEFEVSEPGTFTLWHDHRYQNGHTREEHGPYPGGFTFLIEPSGATGAAPPKFTPLRSGMSQTMSTQSRESSAIGTFEITSPGTYTLQGDNKTKEARRFSLSEGSFLSHMSGFFTRVVLFGILAVLGLALTIGGIIMLVLKPKKPAPTPPALSPS